jgi:hypothetical protein
VAVCTRIGCNSHMVKLCPAKPHRGVTVFTAQLGLKVV